MRNDLHTQLVDTRDLVEGLRALTVSAGDDKLVYLTGTLMDRLLRTITDGIDGCIDVLDDATVRLAAAADCGDAPASDVRAN